MLGLAFAQGKTEQDTIEQALAEGCLSIKESALESPVFHAFIRGASTTLNYKNPSPAQQLSDTISKASRRVGLTEIFRSHDLRQGTVREHGKLNI